MLNVYDVIEILSERIEITRDTTLSDEERAKEHSINAQQVALTGQYLKAVDTVLKAEAVVSMSKSKGMQTLLGGNDE